MPHGKEMSALERMMRPLSRSLTVELARALAGLQCDPDTQARYDDLAGRAGEGGLSPDELAELESIVRANTLLGILKAEARALLAQPAS